MVSQAALDARNARFRGLGTKSMMEEESEDSWDRQRSVAIERLEQAEKVAERIVSKRIPEAVQKVCGWVDLRSSCVSNSAARRVYKMCAW